MSVTRLCVVLAGGAGERMGGDKAQRPLGDRMLGHHALTLAARLAPNVVLAVRDQAQAEGLGPADLVFDPPGVEGPLAGVVGGLVHGERLRAAHVLTIPCDAPLLPADLYAGLEAALERNPGALAATANDGQQDQPACTLWRTAALPPLLRYARTGRRSLHGALSDLKACRAVWPDPGGRMFMNINTTQDLALAEAVWAELGLGQA